MKTAREPAGRLAVVPVRDGALPAGGDEVVAECGGRVVLVGDGAVLAAKHLADTGLGSEVRAWDTPGFAPASWADALVPVLDGEAVLVLPGSPDGRDLAARLAHVLGRPLLAGAIEVGVHGADVARQGGLVIEEIRAAGPFVATLQPGVRGVEPGTGTGDRHRRRRGAGRRPAEPGGPRRPRRRGARGAPARCRHHGPGRGPAHRRRWGRARRRRAVRPAPAHRRRARSVGRRDPRRDRPPLVAPRTPDRHDGRGGRPPPLPGLRHQRRGAAHQRPRSPRPHREREHRCLLPDDAARRPGHRGRRQRRARRARPPPRAGRRQSATARSR